MLTWSQQVRTLVAGSAALVAVASWMGPPGAAAAPPAERAGAAPDLARTVPALGDVRLRVLSVRRGPSALAMRGSATVPPSRAARPRCLGRPATIVGTRRSDRIRGTRGSDVIVGGPGADRISGLGDLPLALLRDKCAKASPVSAPESEKKSPEPSKDAS